MVRPACFGPISRTRLPLVCASLAVTTAGISDQVSPISFASKIRTPVLIVHGEDDTNVPVSQAGSPSATTSSTCSGARVRGSTGGFAMKRPMVGNYRLDRYR